MSRSPLRTALCCLSALIVPLVPAWAQEAAAPASEARPEQQRLSLFDFESETLLAGWAAADGSATLAITRDKANVAGGNGALEFAYEARPGAFQQISTGALGTETAGALSLRVKTTSPTPISLGVAEGGGAQYQGLLWVSANEWVDVRTQLDDLILAQDSFDEDGRLNPAEIAGFFLADLTNLPGEVGQALGHKEGAQRIWLDDLALVDAREAKPRGHEEPDGDERLLVLDDFEGTPFWGLPIRRAGLKAVPGAPKTPGGRALEITYTLGLGRWVGYVLAPPGRFSLANAHQFSMWAKTDLNARLVIALEERDGTKYDTAAKVPPDGKWHPVVASLDAFALSDPAADENGRLDAEQIHRVLILIDTFDADVRPGGFGSVAIDEVGLVVPAGPPGEGTP